MMFLMPFNGSVHVLTYRQISSCLPTQSPFCENGKWEITTEIDDLKQWKRLRKSTHFSVKDKFFPGPQGTYEEKSKPIAKRPLEFFHNRRATFGNPYIGRLSRHNSCSYACPAVLMEGLRIFILSGTVYL